MATPRLRERLLPAMAAEAGISVAELRALMIPVIAAANGAEDDAYVPSKHTLVTLPSIILVFSVGFVGFWVKKS